MGTGAKQDARHTHGRTELPDRTPAADELHLWIHYHTVHAIRDLPETDIDDQAALKAWAQEIRAEPHDIDLFDRRYEYGPSWTVILKTETEPKTLTARNIVRWTLLSIMTSTTDAGAALVTMGRHRSEPWRAPRPPPRTPRGAKGGKPS